MSLRRTMMLLSAIAIGILFVLVLVFTLPAPGAYTHHCDGSTGIYSTSQGVAVLRDDPKCVR